MVVGLAPGLKGANRTGRPFTGDSSGLMLFEELTRAGLASGLYRGEADDAVVLLNCLVTNAVRCVPPANRPTADEIARCRPYLAATIGAATQLRGILALGRIAHDSTLRALGLRPAAFPFAHGARYRLGGELDLFDSYHCSRYNTSTGRLTRPMLAAVVTAFAATLDEGPAP